MPTHDELKDEIEIVEHFRNTRQQEEADSGFSGRAAFSEFQAGQRKIEEDIAAAMEVMKEAQKPNKLKKFLNAGVTLAGMFDMAFGNKRTKISAVKKLEQFRKEILTKRGARRDRALKDFQTTLATLDKKSDFNVREFNAMIGQLDREQKAQGAELNRRMKQKEFGLDEREFNQKTFYDNERLRIQENKNIDDAERNKRLDRADADYNAAILKIKQDDSKRKDVTDDDRAAARAEYSAEQIKIATELAIQQIGSLEKFQIAGYDPNDKERNLLQQYNDVKESFVDSFLGSMPRIADPDTTGADAVDTTQAGLEKIGSAFSPQNTRGQSIESLMGLSDKVNRGLVSEEELIRQRTLEDIVAGSKNFAPPQPTASTRVR